MNEQERSEGWGWLATSKWHYFVGGRSLCNKWAYFGKDLEVGDDDAPGNCAACRKAKARSDTAKQKAQARDG